MSFSSNLFVFHPENSLYCSFVLVLLFPWFHASPFGGCSLVLMEHILYYLPEKGLLLPFPKYSHILRHRGLGLQHMNLGGHNSAHHQDQCWQSLQHLIGGPWRTRTLPQFLWAREAPGSAQMVKCFGSQACTESRSRYWQALGMSSTTTDISSAVASHSTSPKLSKPSPTPPRPHIGARVVYVFSQRLIPSSTHPLARAWNLVAILSISF